LAYYTSFGGCPNVTDAAPEEVGNCLVHHIVDYGTLTAADWDYSIVASVGTISPDTPQQMYPFDVTARVAYELDQAHTTFCLGMRQSDVWDPKPPGVHDYMLDEGCKNRWLFGPECDGLEEPNETRLVVVYE